MSNIKHTFRINWIIGIPVLLSVGVLTGCEYCSPLLLATIAGTVIYRTAKLVHKAMQIKPIH